MSIDFGDVRSVLQRPPSADTWDDLCHVLSMWRSGQREDEILQYTLSHLDRWPSVLRRAPLRWVEGLMRGVSLPFASVVRVLDLSGKHLRNADMQTLSMAPVLEHLDELILDHNDVGIAGIGHLSQSSMMSRLKVLSLKGLRVRDEGLAWIAAAACFASLQELRLGCTGITKRGIEALASTAMLPALHTLALEGNMLEHESVLILCQSKLMERLESLDLSHNRFGVRGVFAMSHKDSRVGTLKRLRMESCRLLEESAELLSFRVLMPHLQELDLSHNLFGGRGVRDLARTSLFPKLRVLRLRGCRPGVEGVQALVTSKHLGMLDVLDFESEDLDLVQRQRLATSKNLSDSVRQIFVSQCQGPHR